MAWNIPIASGAGDFFWVVIVIVAIIARFIKAGSKTTPADTRRTPTAAESPEEELRDFLKRLSQGADQPPELPTQQPPQARPMQRSVAPTPPPLPSHAVRTTASSQASAARARSQQAQRRARTTASAMQPAPRPAIVHAPVPEFRPVAVEPVQVAPPPVQTAAQQAVNRKRAVILEEIKNREVLQVAILLREILGPPLALRQQTRTHPFIG